MLAINVNALLEVTRAALPHLIHTDIKIPRRDRLGGLLHDYAQVA